MGNQAVNLHSECKILIIGPKNSGKTTLFREIINSFSTNSIVKNYFLEQFLLQIFHITLKVAKSCKKEEFKDENLIKTLLELEPNPTENLKKFKEILSIWEEKVMINAFNSKRFQYIKNDE
jgi:AAA+ ATPase superfamily predicted ATPase